MKYSLRDIDFGPMQITAPLYRVVALEVEGASEVHAAIEEWKRSDQDSYEAAISRLLRLRDNRREVALKSKSITPDKEGRGVYEIGQKGGGLVRIFFFYDPNSASLIVCTSVFGKAGGKKRQTKAFNRAAELRKAYLAERYGEK